MILDLTRTSKYVVNTIAIVLLLFIASRSHAQHPVIRVDLDESSRKMREVNENGYTSWQVVPGISDTKIIHGIKITVSKIGTDNSNLGTEWYKVGMQTPYFARLVSDGLTLKSTDPAAAIELRISGLPAGTHHLLTYHNLPLSATGQDFSEIGIFEEGALLAQVQPSVRALKTRDAAKAYISFQAAMGKDVVLHFKAMNTGANIIRDIIINGLEINTPDPSKQANASFPLNADEHVEINGSQLNLRWQGATGAKQHDIYFGKDSAAVANASIRSPLYKGRHTDSVYTAGNIYSGDTYYWRVDEVAPAGITKGNVWYFRPAQLAFPGAEGYGRYARGGRGGKVVHVTNLNDDNVPGSLRYAVENEKGPRTIVFDVSGIITLKERLILNDPYVTVAGQTAPGKGICIKGAPFGSTGNDCIVRNLRVRLGAGRTFDGMGLTGANYSIMDHCSISWTIDEAFSSRGALNITLQRTLISEALNAAGHNKYEAGKQHGFAGTISGSVGSYHHNLLAHCAGRNWSLGGALDGDAYYAGYMDITNNVVYNWKHRTTDGGTKEVNFVNNYYKPGPSSAKFYAFTLDHEGVGKGTQRCYFTGNVMPGYFDETNQEKGRNETWSKRETVKYASFVDKPFFPSFVTTQRAYSAYKNVLSDVGCAQPALDDHDQRIIKETMDSSFTYRGSKTGFAGLIDHQDDAGGWENYPQLSRGSNWDTDGDGLPDWWEQIFKLNTRSSKGDFSDARQDKDRDGYTQLDDYLNWMALPHYETTGGEVVVDLASLTRGFTNQPVYKINSAANGKAELTAGKVAFYPAAAGLASFEFTVMDGDGDTMTRKVNILKASQQHLR
ncbi:hypothetical protein U0035_02035 [Niabella yanshanensis]|uniref:Pectate lyase n=1 Tax=Niabella yanshanensis TaxID=577386 RepID=A0ABZ0W8J6_9BACT|nr:T9SS C-terminal target domain-containing protein [Niabella yanshanensis]WQD38923.1 hypothetical protein U0035_02035 [Niabella yanshanensis]